MFNFYLGWVLNRLALSSTPLIVALFLTLFAVETSAQVYRIHSTTIGRATHTPRLDGDFDAQRSFMERFSVSVFDATGDRSNTLNMHVGFRYYTDFGLPQDLRGDVTQDIAWNYIPLDSAWVEYNPGAGIQVVGGRQHQFDALGVRDFDGARFAFAPRLGEGVIGRVEVYGGRDVQMESGRIDGDSYDVQGLPYQSQYEEADGLILGGRGGLSWRSASFDFAYSRRDYEYQEDTSIDTERVVGQERMGAAMSGNVAPGFNVSAQAAYNRVLDAPDDIRAQFALRLPLATTLSMGIEHRLPWFDSSSVFNVFGAQPRQGAYLTYQVPVDAIQTEFEARGWTRIYHGDLDPFDWGSGEDDEVAFGGALGHDSRMKAWDYPIRWRSLVSAQSSIHSSYGGDQVLVDSALSGKTPGLRSLGLSLRGVFLWANSSTWRYDGSTALALVTGVDFPTEIGDFGLMLEFGSSTQFGANSKAYLVYEVEAWP